LIYRRSLPADLFTPTVVTQCIYKKQVVVPARDVNRKHNSEKILDVFRPANANTDVSATEQSTVAFSRPWLSALETPRHLFLQASGISRRFGTGESLIGDANKGLFESCQLISRCGWEIVERRDLDLL
jgi:hypothetical protein